MTNNKTKAIILTIKSMIDTGEYKPNDKLPSEKQLAIMHDVSRSVTTGVFKKLMELDIVYSVPQKGFFVAEQSALVAKPLKTEFDFDETCKPVQNQPSKQFAQFIKPHNLADHITHQANFMLNGTIVIAAEISASGEHISTVDSTVPFFDQVLNTGKLKSLIKEVRFEDEGSQMQIYEYRTYYLKGDEVILARLKIDHKVYRSTKRELAL